MSNYLAIAATTATLQNILTAAAAVVPGASVTTLRPDSSPAATRPPGINIYLFQVTPNPHWRNSDLPTRTPNGQIIERPRAALDLHYLLSFFGDDTQFQPQRLLGNTVRLLHAQPILPRAKIAETVANPPFTTFPDRSDLANQIEQIRFVPLSLSLEELSKIWSVFFQTPFALSIAYQGSVVLVEGAETPETGPPVRERNVLAIPLQTPVIDRIISAAGAAEPIVAGSTLVIQGSQLRGETTVVLLGGQERPPLTVRESEITLPVPADLPAGISGLQVIHKVLLGTPPTLHRGVQSSVAAFVYRPSLSSPSGGAASVTFTVSPLARKGQRLTLLLSRVPGSAPESHTFELPPLVADTATPVFPIKGVKSGTYLVRVQVDGAESPLSTDSTGLYNGPTVTIP